MINGHRPSCSLFAAAAPLLQEGTGSVRFVIAIVILVIVILVILVIGDQRAVWQRAVSSRQGLNRHRQVYPHLCPGWSRILALHAMHFHDNKGSAPAERALSPTGA